MLMKRVLVLSFLALPSVIGAIDVDLGVRAFVDYYALIDPATFYSSERLRFTVSPELSLRTEKRLFDLSLSAVAYAQGFSTPNLIDPERILRDAYLGLHIGLADLYIGQKIVSWGKVDVLSPLNNVNHGDATVLSIDAPLEGTMPDLLLQLRFYPSDLLSLELVYVPFLKPDEIGVEELAIQNRLELSIPGQKTQIYDLDATFRNPRLGPFEQWAHAYHAALHLLSYWVDVTAAYSYFVDQAPDFDLSDLTEITTEDADAITRSIRGSGVPGYNRAHSFGLASSFYVADYLVSADIAIKLTSDLDGSRMEIKNNEAMWVAQVERLFWNNRLRVQANLLHRLVLNYGAEIASAFSPVVEAYLKATIDAYLFQSEQSQLYALLHADARFLRERLSSAFTLIYGFDEGITYVIPRLSYVLNDYVSVSAGADLWFGDASEGFLGVNLERDNFFIRAQLRY